MFRVVYDRKTWLACYGVLRKLRLVEKMNTERIAAPSSWEAVWKAA